MQEKSHKTVALLMLLGASFFWGTTFIFTKILVNFLSVREILFYRTVLTCLILHILFFREINIGFLKAIKSKELFAFSTVGTIALFLQTESLKYTTVSNCAFITALSVIFVPVIKFIHFKTHLKHMFYLAVAMAISGIYLISYGSAIPSGINPGDFLTFLSAICYGYFIVILENVSKKFSSPIIVCHYFLFMLLCSFIMFSFDFSYDRLNIPLTPFIFSNILGLAILGGIIPYILMAKGQKHIPSHVAGLIYNFEAVFASILSITILGDTLGFSKLIGCAIIFASLVIGSKNS